MFNFRVLIAVGDDIFGGQSATVIRFTGGDHDSTVAEFVIEHGANALADEIGLLGHKHIRLRGLVPNYENGVYEVTGTLDEEGNVSNQSIEKVF